MYQQETLASILALFLSGPGNSVPHHCLTKSESAISRFFNHYKWSTLSLIRTQKSNPITMMLSELCVRLLSIARSVEALEVTGGPRGVAQMFSFLETMRLQGGDAIASLCELLSLAGRSPPGLQSL